VAHLKPPAEAVRRALEPAAPRWVVTPKYVAGAPADLKRVARGPAFMQLADSAFNYHLHGRSGFDLLARVIRSCDCYEFSYHRLEDAVAVFEELAGQP
jgi:hypothetical protein